MSKQYKPKRKNTMPRVQQQWLHYLAVRLCSARRTKAGILLPPIKAKLGEPWASIDFEFKASDLADLGRDLRAIAKGKDARVVLHQKPGSGRPAQRGKNIERLAMYGRLLHGGASKKAAREQVVAALPGVSPDSLKRYVRKWTQDGTPLPQDPETIDPNTLFESLD